MLRCFYCGKFPKADGSFEGPCMVDRDHVLESPQVAANRSMNEILAAALDSRGQRWKIAEVEPKCPDCGTQMVFIDEDMTGQGGPPEETWFCTNGECGLAVPWA